MLFIILHIVMLYILLFYTYYECCFVLVTSSITFHRANSVELTNFDMKYKQTYNTYRVDRRLLLRSHSLALLKACAVGGTHTQTHTHTLISRHWQRCGGEGRGSAVSIYSNCC